MPIEKKTAPNHSKNGDYEVPIEDIKVVLTPILGIEPRIYVRIVWAFLAALVLFLLLVLPGIRKNGTVLTVNSSPADASVIVDGIRLGASGEPVFAPKGEKSLIVMRPGFITHESTINVKGRIFASRLFPRKQTVSVVLGPQPDGRPFAGEFREFALWAATGKERDNYAIPPSLTKAARDAVAAKNPADGLLEAALPLASDERHLADLLRSEIIRTGGGAPFSAVLLLAAIDSAAEMLHAGTVSFSGVMMTMDEETAKSFGWSDLYTEAEEGVVKIAHSAAEYYEKTPLFSNLTQRSIGNLRFVSIPAADAFIGDIEAVNDGYMPRSGAYPTPASVSSYLIGTTEISNGDFSLFLEASPEWSLENIDSLIQSGLADEDYLSSWTSTPPPSETAREPVTGVSWHAAEAYADWFTKTYLAGTNLHAELPREDEWEIAARLNHIVEDVSELDAGLKNVSAADGGTLGLKGMAGNVREWCSNPYRRNEYLYGKTGGPSFQASDAALAAPERTVRGGAYIDGKLSYPAAVRGGLRPETTSPVIGFRLVIVE